MKAFGAGMALLIVAFLATSAFTAPAADPLAEARAAAEAGNAEAQFQLGEAYRQGKGVSQNRETAIQWFKRAATRGHAQASDNLGFLLFTNGSRSEAMPYIEKAAARGDPRAFYLLGTAHFNGDYAERDWPLAYAQMSRAAEAGLAAAKQSLAVMDRYLLDTDKAKAAAILTTLPPIKPLNAPTTVPTPVAAQVAPAAQAAPQPAPTPRGNYRVQLGAYASAEKASGEWDRIAARAPLLKNATRQVVAFGAVQRLQASGLDRAGAEALCRQVRGTGGACFVIAP